MSYSMIEARVEEHMFLLEKAVKNMPELNKYVEQRLKIKEAKKQEWLDNTFHGKLKKA